MISLSKEQIIDRNSYFNNYCCGGNNATLSEVDSNANVDQKNIATVQAEIHKPFNIQENRARITSIIEEVFGKDIANQYNMDIKNHIIYVHDESNSSLYCASISLYPFLVDGMSKLGCDCTAPKHLASFCGQLINLVFYVASQLCGAVAIVEFLSYFAYFARKDYGENWFESKCGGLLDSYLSQVVYSLNQPAMARGAQSVFWNLSILDEYYFNYLFTGFYFPDGSTMHWEDVNKLQKYFLEWFREERKKALLTFPVVTMSVLTDGKKTWKSQEYLDLAATEYEKGSEFFIYNSDSVDSLSSCCRLRNAIHKSQFSYTLGAGGIMTGSKNVITLNMNRIIQQHIDLGSLLDRVYMYQVAHDTFYHKLESQKMLPICSAGFVDLSKLYLTIGVNGMVEAGESLGYTISPNSEYLDWCTSIFSLIHKKNVEAGKKYKLMFNTEIVPAENLGVKNATWDKKSGLIVNRNCYNSYLYKVEDPNLSVYDKILMQGGERAANLDGGSATHWNNNERLTKAQYKNIFEYLVVAKNNYFCENVPKSICKNEKCGYIHPNHVTKCPKCGSPVEYAERIIGYLKPISSYSKERQEEYSLRWHDHSFLTQEDERI